MSQSPTLQSDFTDYEPGDLIGHKYRLERLLGEGAQGSVWLAEHLSLATGVAIKLVHGEAENPAPTLRLEKEARAAAQIAHPAVVRVFDLGRTVSGDAFIVMEFLEGESLAERLATCKRLSPVETLRTLLPIADVLHVAHARGIVHRDLKPENVFLSRHGDSLQPKLLDFGIAKLYEPKRTESVITEVGMLVGSPAYVSPEQADCRDDVGKGADVWSFCVVLYECLTGSVPFDSENCRELFRQIEEEAPRSILSYGVGDLELWDIVRRGLAKSPSERWPNMHELGQALAAWLRERGVQDDLSGHLLEAKWFGRGCTDVGLAPRDLEASGLVRRGANDRTALAWRATERASRPAAKRRYVAVGAVVTAVAAAIAVAIVGWLWSTEAKATDTNRRDAKLAAPPTLEPPRVLASVARSADLAPPAAELPDGGVPVLSASERTVDSSRTDTH